MMDTELLYCLTVLTTIFLIIYTRERSIQSTKQTPAPSPRGLPILGHLHLLKDHFHPHLQSLTHHYGLVFLLRLGYCRLLVVSSPQAIEECFTRNDIIFANRPNFLAGKILGYNYKNLGWVPYGDLWRNLRRVTTLQAFSSHRLQQSASIRTEEIRSMARELLGHGSGQEVDLHKTFFQLTRNVVMRGLSGRRWRSGPDEQMFASTKIMTVGDFSPVLRWLGFKRVEMERVLAARDGVAAGLIEEERKVAAYAGEGGDRNTMVKELLALQKVDPHYYTDDILKGIIVVQEQFKSVEDLAVRLPRLRT